MIFLTLPIALVQFSALAMEDISRQTMPPFGKVELLERTAPPRLVVDEVQRVNRLVDTSPGTQACAKTFTVGYELALNGLNYSISTSTVRRDCSMGQELTNSR